MPLVLALCPESRRPIEVGFRLYGVARVQWVNRLRAAQPRNAGHLAPATGEKYQSLNELFKDMFSPEEAAAVPRACSTRRAAFVDDMDAKKLPTWSAKAERFLKISTG